MPGAIQSLAVLPLENLSGDASQDYFSDGMTDALITELSHIRKLRVISRTSVMQYKRTQKSLEDIARDLNVDAVVEGSVVRANGRVRISAKLIQTSIEQQQDLWATATSGISPMCWRCRAMWQRPSRGAFRCSCRNPRRRNLPAEGRWYRRRMKRI